MDDAQVPKRRYKVTCQVGTIGKYHIAFLVAKINLKHTREEVFLLNKKYCHLMGLWLSSATAILPIRSAILARISAKRNFDRGTRPGSLGSLSNISNASHLLPYDLDRVYAVVVQVDGKRPQSIYAVARGISAVLPVPPHVPVPLPPIDTDTYEGFRSEK